MEASTAGGPRFTAQGREPVAPVAQPETTGSVAVQLAVSVASGEAFAPFGCGGATADARAPPGLTSGLIVAAGVSGTAGTGLATVTLRASTGAEFPAASITLTTR